MIYEYICVPKYATPDIAKITTLTRTVVDPGDPIKIQHTADGKILHHHCIGISCLLEPSFLY